MNLVYLNKIPATILIDVNCFSGRPETREIFSPETRNIEEKEKDRVCTHVNVGSGSSTVKVQECINQ